MLAKRKSLLLKRYIIFLATLACWFPVFSVHAQSFVVTNFSEVVPLMNENNVPDTWSLKIWEGTPEITIRDENHEKVIHLKSHQSSIALYREVEFELDTSPILTWNWKVTILPKEANSSLESQDDQAAGIYVVFPRFPAFINSQVIGYIWDNELPEGTVVKSPKNSQVHYVVVRSGYSDLGKWISESRNVLEDYNRIYGEHPPDIGGISFMIDSDDTQSSAESYFGKVKFHNIPQLASR